MSDFQYIVTPEDRQENRTVGRLIRRLPISSRLRTKIKKEETFFLNGKKVSHFVIPQPGDCLTVKIPEEKSHFPPQDIPIVPLYEDEDFLLIDKPAGYVVHPTKGHPDRTMANGLTFYMEKTNQFFKIRFINRLDRDTSGVLALGKHSHAQDQFIQQNQRGQVKKEYLALVHGLVEAEQGTIDLPIGLKEPGDLKRRVYPEGRPSITHYRVQERFDSGYTLLSLTLETGRTHQIRVHLSHIGHPIVSDELYGQWSPHLIERQALHASCLTFHHPRHDTPIQVKAPLPEDMKKLMNHLRQNKPKRD